MIQPDRMPRVLTAEQRALVAQFIPLAEKICARFVRQKTADYIADDLHSVAVEALHDAACTYDPAVGTPFGYHVWRRVDGALSRARKTESKHWHAAREDAYDAADVVEDTSQVLTDTDADTTAHADGMADEVVAAPVLHLVGRALKAEGEEGERLRAAYGRLIGAAEAVLAGMSEEARRVLVGHHIDGRTWQALASELGCSERTAKRRGAEARKRFADALRARQAGAQGEAVHAGEGGSAGAASR